MGQARYWQVMGHIFSFTFESRRLFETRSIVRARNTTTVLRFPIVVLAARGHLVPRDRPALESLIISLTTVNIDRVGRPIRSSSPLLFNAIFVHDIVFDPVDYSR